MQFAESFKKIVSTEKHRFDTTPCANRRHTAVRVIAFMLHAAVFEHRFTPSEAVSLAREVWPELPGWWNLLGALHGEPADSAAAWETKLSRIILAS